LPTQIIPRHTPPANPISSLAAQGGLQLNPNRVSYVRTGTRPRESLAAASKWRTSRAPGEQIIVHPAPWTMNKIIPIITDVSWIAWHIALLARLCLWTCDEVVNIMPSRPEVVIRSTKLSVPANPVDGCKAASNRHSDPPSTHDSRSRESRQVYLSHHQASPSRGDSTAQSPSTSVVLSDHTTYLCRLGPARGTAV